MYASVSVLQRNVWQSCTAYPSKKQTGKFKKDQSQTLDTLFFYAVFKLTSKQVLDFGKGPVVFFSLIRTF